MTTIAEEQRRLREDLELRGINDERVLDAIEHVRRDVFVPESIRQEAFADTALPIGEGQTISQPYIVALMTQELRLSGNEKVLEVGTGSGYQAAILARLCQQVVSIERITALAESARRTLDSLGIANVEIVVGDGTLGWADRAPYDRIIVTACAPNIPEPLYDQLKPGGYLVAPVGDEGEQELLLIEKTPLGPEKISLCGCRFVKLIGEAGWPVTE